MILPLKLMFAGICSKIKASLPSPHSSTLFLSLYISHNYLLTIFLKIGQPRPLFRLFSVSIQQTSLQLLQQIYVKKCPSSVQCRDSNPQPLERESLPITSQPGLPPSS